MSDLDLDRLEDIHSGVTRGRWVPAGDAVMTEDDVGSSYVLHGATDGDAAAITSAVNAMPLLIARIRELEAENGDLRRDNERLRDLERETTR